MKELVFGRFLKYFVLMWVSLVLLSASLFAEPDSTFKYLINEKASLLDLGIWQMNSFLNERVKVPSCSYTSATADYDWEKNRIVVDGYCAIKNENIDELKEVCRELIKQTKITLGDSLSMFPGSNQQGRMVAIYFLHRDFDNPAKTKTLENNINNQTDIVGKVQYSRDRPIIECQSSLTTSKVLFSQ